MARRFLRQRAHALGIRRNFVVLAAAALLVAALGSPPPGLAQPANRGVYVLFIQGINSSSVPCADAADTADPSTCGFVPLAQKLNDALGDRLIGAVFDYRGGLGYGPTDTFGDINTASELVNVYLRQSGTHDRDVFLVGHSMGGVVAALAVSKFKGFPDGSTARLAGVVTLDSPLQGVRTDMSRCFRGLEDLGIPITAVEQMRPESPTIASIQDVVQRTGVPFLTVGAAEDCVVPVEQTGLPGSEPLIGAFGEEGAQYDARESHGLVLSSADVLSKVSEWIAAHATGPTPSRPVPTLPNAGQIAYVGSDGNIWLIAPDGSNPQAITRAGANERFQSPHWAPGGSVLAFLSVVQAANSGTVRLGVYRNGATETLSAPELPAYDGGYNDIAFSRSGDAYIVVHWTWPPGGVNPASLPAIGSIGPDGSDEQTLLSYSDLETLLSPNDVATQIDVSSRDGHLLVTTFNVLHQTATFLMAGANGQGLTSWWPEFTPLLQSGGVAWAAGGQDLLAARCRAQCIGDMASRNPGRGQPVPNQQADLVQVDRDGHVVKVLAPLPPGGMALKLAPAPDGSAVAFDFLPISPDAHADPGPRSLYVVKVPGGSPVRLGEGAEPSWQPIEP